MLILDPLDPHPPSWSQTPHTPGAGAGDAALGRLPLCSLRPHLDLQLLHHLHLDAALRGAPVIQGVLCVEVSLGGGGGGEEKVGPSFPAVTTLPPHPRSPPKGLESRQTKKYKEGKGEGKKKKTKKNRGQGGSCVLVTLL